MTHTYPIRERIIRLEDVRARTGLSRSTIYAWLSADEFPKPINLGGRSVGWIEREIDEWINARITDSRGYNIDERGIQTNG